MLRREKTEKGQTLIIIMFGLVALLGFAALSIDGGMFLSNRRMAQNTADMAAFAGAGEVLSMIQLLPASALNCDNFAVGSANWTAVTDKAIASAASNGHTIDADITDGNGVEVICNAGAEKYVEVHVEVSAETNKSLIYLFFEGPLVNQVEAMTRVWPFSPGLGGASIVALKETCTRLDANNWDGGVTIAGEADVAIQGGGIVSNACLNTLGSTGSITVTTGNITYSEDSTWTNEGGKTISPAPATTGDTVFILAPSLAAACSSLPTYGNVIPGGSPADAETVITPGNYNNIEIANGRKLYMYPGLYCISGYFKAKGGAVLADWDAAYPADPTITPPASPGVTIFMPETAGTFYTAGTSHVVLTAQDPYCELSDSCEGEAIGGLLLVYLPSYVSDGENSTKVTLQGDATSTYEGTVLAPNTYIDIGGSSSLASVYGVQAIGESVNIRGSTDITLVYDPSKVYSLRGNLSLMK